MRAALKALSYPDIDIRKTYPIERALRTAAGRPVLFYKPWDHVVHYGDHDIPVRIFSPETEGEHAILLFFHGGGWVTGNIDSYDKVCRNMAKLTDPVRSCRSITASRPNTASPPRPRTAMRSRGKSSSI